MAMLTHTFRPFRRLILPRPLESEIRSWRAGRAVERRGRFSQPLAGQASKLSCPVVRLIVERNCSISRVSTLASGRAGAIFQRPACSSTCTAATTSFLRDAEVVILLDDLLAGMQSHGYPPPSQMLKRSATAPDTWCSAP
jgi:hypothetical protein